MCTNALECYMDDLVDCFEDFVRKSLLVISVAVGTIILMVMYVLKVLAERAVIQRERSIHGRGSASQFRCLPSKQTSCRRADSDSQLKAKSDITMGTRGEVHSTYTMNTANSSRNSDQSASRPSLDERVLREIGLATCSKPCNTSEQNVVPECPDSRVSKMNEEQYYTKDTLTEENTAYNNPTCMSKHHLSESRPCLKYIGVRTSCCSMCCADHDRR